MVETKAVRRILLVEDDEADVVHFRRLCHKHSVEAEIEVASDGDAALLILKATGHAAVVLVTDLNMPGMSGHELIEEIRGDARLANKVIFVLSTSDLPRDIEQAYAHHVAGYIVKDTRGVLLDAGVNMLGQYLKTVALP